MGIWGEREERDKSLIGTQRRYPPARDLHPTSEFITGSSVAFSGSKIGKDSMGSHVCAWAYTHLPIYLYMYVCIPHREMEKKKIVLEYELKELNDSLKKVETKINSIMEEKEDVIKEVESKRALLEIREREYNQLVKLLELTRENEATSLTERLVIFLCICHPNLSSAYI